MKQYITQSDLPIACPMKGHSLWDAHPRVYLPIEHRGFFTCPYCGIKYILENRQQKIKDRKN